MKPLISIVAWGLAVGGAFSDGMNLIHVTDSEVGIHLDAAVAGNVSVLEINPFDTLNPRRELTENSPDSQNLDLSNEGYLRMTFLNGSLFDPQITFTEHPVSADYVSQFSMRVRVSGTQSGADMPFRLFVYNVGIDWVDFMVPADGAWHTLRADLDTLGASWYGTQFLRLDPAEGQGFAPNQSAVVDIDWLAVTYKSDFSGDRNYTGKDVFIDLGVPESSWSGTAQSLITLPRYDGPRDRLFSKYILTDGGTNQIGDARYVTDLSGLSYQTDSDGNWTTPSGYGLLDPVPSNGIAILEYVAPTLFWDPRIQASASELVDLDVAKEFSIRYRIQNYLGSQTSVPFGLFGFISGSGMAYLTDGLIPDGEWHVYRTTLSGAAWHGDAQLRFDAPDNDPGTYPAADFIGATLELDWIAVTDNAFFAPAAPLCDGGRLWEFSSDRTQPLMKPVRLSGLWSDGVPEDLIDLGCGSYKMAYHQASLLDLGLSPAEVHPVDEFSIGINQGMVDYYAGLNKYFTDRNVASYVVDLNSILDYWLDEGTADQRFNPVRNPLTVENPPVAYSVAHNVMDPLGIAHYRGALEYFGAACSDPSGSGGELYGFIIGNEVDAHYAWYNLGDIEIEKVVDMYLTVCRIADLSLRKVNPNFRVYPSFTHYWNRAHEGSLRSGKPKYMVDLFAAKAKAEGDFPWGLCIHPYSVDLLNPAFWSESGPTDDFNTEYITFKNLQVARRYLQQSSMLYQGQVRPIVLGEQGFHTVTDGNSYHEARQAAALAYSLKITEQVPGVESHLYHRQLDFADESGLRFGLGIDDPNTAGNQYLRKRPSWYVMRDHDTPDESATFDPYLSYISTISAWSDINLADIRLVYEFDEADADIVPTQINPFQITNGVAAGTVTGTDPKLTHVNVNTYGDGQETCILRIKTEEAGDWQFYWGKDGGPISEVQSVTFPISASVDYQFYTFDLSADSNWVGQNITTWRLDPAGSASAYDFEIDYFMFGPTGDFDGDGIPDSEETMVDLDGDGLPNLADLDSNGSGYSDSREKLLGLDPLSNDSDSDGVDGDWEAQYGFNPHNAADAVWDVDLDSYTTLDEYIADTDPNDGFDYLKQNGIAVNLDGSVSVFVDGKADRSYTLWRTTDLVSNVWDSVVLTTPLSASAPIELVDTNVTDSAMYIIGVEK